MSDIEIPEANNMEAALSAYAAIKKRDGVVSDEALTILIRLQDNPDELIKKLLELEAGQ